MQRRPENRGKLPPEDKTLLEKWVKEKGCKCPACGALEWGEANQGGFSFLSGNQGHRDDQPAIILPCSRCGYLSLFCPFTIGIERELP